MKTLMLDVTTENIALAAEVISRGGLVAFPTETVYGLGADALNAEAVARIYEAKGRPSDNPMIVHIADVADLARLTSEITPDMETIAKALWPGPVTMVVKKLSLVPDRTTGGLDTVAIRMPDSEPALELIRQSGKPIAAPSANLSGSPSPTRAKDVIADMDGRIDAIICGADCQVGIESTVVDMTGEIPTILRPGIITAAKLEEILGHEVKYDDALKAKVAGADPAKGVSNSEFKPKSPGMKYKHYAPKAEMVIFEGAADKVAKAIEARKAEAEAAGKKVGIIRYDENDPARAAQDFFARLRDLDAEGVDIILAGALNQSDEVGMAVMNRMLKSAGYNIINI